MYPVGAPPRDAVVCPACAAEHWTAAAAATAGNLKILATAGSPTDAGTLSAQLMCGIVEAMPVPVTNANRDAMTALLEFLTSSGAGGAPGADRGLGALLLLSSAGALRFVCDPVLVVCCVRACGGLLG